LKPTVDSSRYSLISRAFKIIRIFLSLAVGIVALSIAVFASLGLYSWAVGQEPYAMRTARYMGEFRSAETYIEWFRKRENRLPTIEELRTINIPGIDASQLSISDECPEPDVKPVKGTRYVLARWAGEFHECYFSPSGISTATETARYMTKIDHRLSVILAGTAIVLALISWLVWPRRKPLRAL
jgi:hypothetical protein